MTDELNRDRAAAEAAQRAASDLQAQVTAAGTDFDTKMAAARAAKAELDDLGERIERARLYVSREDTAAVSRFNNDVTKYNRMLKQVHQKMAISDALVVSYNALLARAKAKSDEADRLVDAYNQKLARVGH
jgi:glutaredoxin 2